MWTSASVPQLRMALSISISSPVVTNSIGLPSLWDTSRARRAILRNSGRTGTMRRDIPISCSSRVILSSWLRDRPSVPPAARPPRSFRLPPHQLADPHPPDQIPEPVETIRVHAHGLLHRSLLLGGRG